MSQTSQRCARNWPPTSCRIFPTRLVKPRTSLQWSVHRLPTCYRRSSNFADPSDSAFGVAVKQFGQTWDLPRRFGGSGPELLVCSVWAGTSADVSDFTKTRALADLLH